MSCSPWQEDQTLGKMLTISKHERNFGAVSCWELESALAYGLPREVVLEDQRQGCAISNPESLKDIVAELRNDLGLKSFGDALGLELQIFLPARFFVPIAWPEWPENPYLSIDERTRRERVAQAEPKVTDCDRGHFLTRRRPGDIHVDLYIPPWMPNEEIVKEFAAFLRHRKIGRQIPNQVGRPASAEHLRDTLFSLVVYRLWRTGLSRYDIIHQIQDAKGNYRYKAEKALDKPLARAKAQIKSGRTLYIAGLRNFRAASGPIVLLNRELKKLGPKLSLDDLNKLLSALPDNRPA
jgi:hypothetical protein